MMSLATYYRGRVTFKELYSELEFRVVKVFQKNMFNDLKSKNAVNAKAAEKMEDDIMDANMM